ncbi:MAG: DUF4422 domain-containing protein [Alistipes putredinis]
MSKTVILVCAHKQDACLKTPPYQPVQVGRAISASGTSARRRRRHGRQPSATATAATCELTAHYWAWKNLHDARLHRVRTTHRRYFDFEGGSACSLRTVRSGSLLLGTASGPRLRPPLQPLAISSWPGRRSIPTTSTRIIASATSKATC